MPTVKSVAAGDVFGRYQVLVPIGQGGMGQVWVAREVGPGHTSPLVALKTALADGYADDELWNLLVDKARVASLIQHPNVCTIHGLDVERGVGYLVIGVARRGSVRELRDLLPEHRIDAPLAVRIVAQVALGLQAAHELVDAEGTPFGIIDRDVSPQNILLSSSGDVKLIDFGIAKARGQVHAPTQTGNLKGKKLVHGAGAGDDEEHRCARGYLCTWLRALRSDRGTASVSRGRHANNSVRHP